MKITNAFEEPPSRSSLTSFVPPAEFPFLTTPPGDTSLPSFLPEDWLEDVWPNPYSEKTAGVEASETEPEVFGLDVTEEQLAALHLRLAEERVIQLDVEIDLLCAKATNATIEALQSALCQMEGLQKVWNARSEEPDLRPHYRGDLPGDLWVLREMSDRFLEFSTSLLEGCDRALTQLDAAAAVPRLTFSPGTKPGISAPAAGAESPSNKTNQRQGQQ